MQKGYCQSFEKCLCIACDHMCVQKHVCLQRAQVCTGVWACICLWRSEVTLIPSFWDLVSYVLTELTNLARMAGFEPQRTACLHFTWDYQHVPPHPNFFFAMGSEHQTWVPMLMWQMFTNQASYQDCFKVDSSTLTPMEHGQRFQREINFLSQIL